MLEVIPHDPMFLPKISISKKISILKPIKETLEKQN